MSLNSTAGRYPPLRAHAARVVTPSLAPGRPHSAPRREAHPMSKKKDKKKDKNDKKDKKKGKKKKKKK
jgi:hypothetical protein